MYEKRGRCVAVVPDYSFPALTDITLTTGGIVSSLGAAVPFVAGVSPIGTVDIRRSPTPNPIPS